MHPVNITQMLSRPVSGTQDEIDDSRKTLQYAISELQKDVEKELLALPESERDAQRTEFAVFVVHNKLKNKLGKLSDSIPYVFHRACEQRILKRDYCRYYAGDEVDDLWYVLSVI